jgi:hypothetical protein
MSVSTIVAGKKEQWWMTMAVRTIVVTVIDI